MQFTAPATVPCLTIAGLEVLTGLSFTDPTEQVGDALRYDTPGALSDPARAAAADDALPVVRASIPADPGIYAWAGDRAAPIVYHGRGVGGRGLRGRLGNELSWGLGYATAVAVDADPVRNVEVGGEVPLVRLASGGGLRPFYLVEQPAPWADGPSSASEWEAFVSEASRIITGHRSLVGGGAWEAKAGSVGDRMWTAAQQRLVMLGWSLT